MIDQETPTAVASTSNASEDIRKFEEGYVTPHEHTCRKRCTTSFYHQNCGHTGVRLVLRPSLVLKRHRARSSHCGVPMLRVTVFETWTCCVTKCEYRGALERPFLHGYCEVCNHLIQIGGWA